MDIIKTELTIRSHLKQVTPLVPEILFSANAKDILVSFQGNIPDEKTTIEIENVLKAFGKPKPNHCRESAFISFIILR